MLFKSYTQAEMMLSNSSSIRKSCYTCQWLDNVDMHLNAKCDQHIPCCSRDTLVNVYVDLVVFTRIAGSSLAGSGRYWY